MKDTMLTLAVKDQNLQIRMQSGTVVCVSPEDLLSAIRYALHKDLIRPDQLPQHAPIERTIHKLSNLLQRPIRQYERDEQVLLQTARARLMEVRDLLVRNAARREALG